MAMLVNYIATIGLAAFCYLADDLMETSFISGTTVLKAITDNAAHGIIAAWSWAITTSFSSTWKTIYEIIICFICSCGLDIDHFVAARSIKLKVILFVLNA